MPAKRRHVPGTPLQFMLASGATCHGWRSDRWRSTSRHAEADGKLGEAAEHETVAVGPAQLAAVNGKLEIGEATEQRAKGDPRLEPSEGCTQTEMDAVSESEMWTRLTADVKHRRVVVEVRIMIGRTEANQHLLTCRDLHAGQIHGLCRDTKGCVRNGRRKPDQLLDRGGQPRRDLTKASPLVRTLEMVNNPVADEAGGRVVPRDDQLEQARKQLLLGQAVVIVAGGHRHTDKIVLG